MTTERLFELFKKNNTKQRDGVTPNADFFRKYGNEATFESAFEVYMKSISEFTARYEKINKFEEFLISEGAQHQQSRISESRYYNYKGMKYRFSGHIYPTGSMTNDFTIDLAAEPELIDNINF